MGGGKASGKLTFQFQNTLQGGKFSNRFFLRRTAAAMTTAENKKTCRLNNEFSRKISLDFSSSFDPIPVLGHASIAISIA
jgi:hypothetical protein